MHPEKADGSPIECSGRVPISAAQCYKSQNPEIGDVNIGFNDDLINKWLGKVPVTFSSAPFSIPISKNSKYFLKLSGIDTIGKVTLNNKTDDLWTTNNTFADFVFDVTNFLQSDKNHLAIVIEPPVLEANHIAETDPIHQPPSCQYPHSQCNINRLRKPGYSFACDWGPSLPDSGIYHPPIIYEISKNAWKILGSRIQLFSKVADDLQVVRVDLDIQAENDDPVSNDATLTVQLESLSNQSPTQIDMKIRPYTAFATPTQNGYLFSSEFEVKTGDIRFWWPNGHGEPYLYNATITLSVNKGVPQSEGHVFGFRTVE